MSLFANTPIVHLEEWLVSHESSLPEGLQQITQEMVKQHSLALQAEAKLNHPIVQQDTIVDWFGQLIFNLVFTWPLYILNLIVTGFWYISLGVIAGSVLVIYFTYYIQLALFWLPIAYPIMQVCLIPMAAFFYFFPDTIYTNPSMFPKEATIAQQFYQWFVGNIMYLANQFMTVMTYLGHPLNYTVKDELNLFFGDDVNTMTSQDAAMVFVMFWMTLPYILPYAFANNFYLWWAQIPVEIIQGYQTAIHFEIPFDKKCEFDIGTEEQNACLANRYFCPWCTS